PRARVRDLSAHRGGHVRVPRSHRGRAARERMEPRGDRAPGEVRGHRRAAERGAGRAARVAARDTRAAVTFRSHRAGSRLAGRRGRCACALTRARARDINDARARTRLPEEGMSETLPPGLAPGY